MKSIIKGGQVLLPHANDFVKLEIVVDDSGYISELGMILLSLGMR